MYIQTQSDQYIYEIPYKYMRHFMHTRAKGVSHISPGKWKGESQTELFMSRYTGDVVNLEIIAGGGSRTQALPLDTIDIIPQPITKYICDRTV